MHDDFTIVMQGRPHDNTVPALEHYLNFTPNVIFAHTDEFTPPDHLKDKIQCINVFEDGNNKLPPWYYNQQNCYYQFRSAAAGVSRAWSQGAEYVIKLRSDKFYGNLTPLIEKIKDSPYYMLVTGNLHFRPDSHCHFHPCDQIFGGGVQQVRLCLELARKRCECSRELLVAGMYEYADTASVPMPLWGGPVVPCEYTVGHDQKSWLEIDAPTHYGSIRKLFMGYEGTFPEVILGTSWLLVNGIQPDRTNAKEQMRKYFDIVPIESMVPYKNKDMSTKVEHNWASISSMNDL